MKRAAVLAACLFLVAFLPAIARADAGTPLMWATIVHLLFGNFFIGIGEGLLLAIIYRRKVLPCLVVLVAANYFSAWVGAIFLDNIRPSGVDIYSASRWLWTMVWVTYAMTLVLEWPFVAYCLRKTDHWLRNSLWGSLIVQTASYVLLFGWYASASHTSLLTDVALVPASKMHVGGRFRLCYIAPQGGDVYAMDLGGGEPRKIATVPSQEPIDSLSLQESVKSPHRWDLIWSGQYDGGLPRPQTVLADFATQAAVPRPGSTLSLDVRWDGLGPEVCLGTPAGSDWSFSAGAWASGGLIGHNTKEHRDLRLAVDTPFVHYLVRHVTHLPGDLIVFQLGEDQICMLDVNRREVALLARGHGPVVAVCDDR